jgi:hypothetical protein
MGGQYVNLYGRKSARGRGLDSIGPGYESMLGSSEHGNEPSDSIKVEAFIG